jgi:hypothetical protein
MLKATLLGIAAAALYACAANAAIQCEGPYQIIHGDRLATPYCGDNYLAHVAQRDYGSRVSAFEVRNNPNKKQEVCLFVGADIRVKDICTGFRSDNGGGFRF